MYYKLSNIAEKDEIESLYSKPLLYPNLYNPKQVIDGLREENLWIRTCERPDVLSLAIWGLLPQDYEGDWRTFQQIKNTLNFHVDSLENDICFGPSLYNRRCVVIVTGFFTNYLENGSVSPYYIHLSSEKPFALAAIYNELEDGFLTCAILLTNKSKQLQRVQNLCDDGPVLLNKKEANRWLNKDLPPQEVYNILKPKERFMFKAKKVSRTIYDKSHLDLDILGPKKLHETPRNGSVNFS